MKSLANPPFRSHAGVSLLLLCLATFTHTIEGLSNYPAFSTSLRQPMPTSASTRSRQNSIQLYSSFGGREQDPVVEAIQSLVDFHEGTWKGQARSFTVSQDIAAGIIKRKQSPTYTVSVKLGLDSNRDYALTETMCWGNDNEKISSRSLSLNACNADVDSVDASYSLDSNLPDFPTEISGTDKISQFVIEHCIAASNDRRVRCLVFYGLDQSLLRVVICEENRVKKNLQKDGDNLQGTQEGLTASDLLEMESDVDRLVDKIAGNLQPGGPSDSGSKISGSNRNDILSQLQQSASGSQQESVDDASLQLLPHRMTLVELTSGVWLGDSVIRDHPMIQGSPEQPGRGFGSVGKSRSSGAATTFGSWDLGVQKVAWRWMWNFGEEIRQVNDVGKAMGSTMSQSLQQSLAGTVCINESLSRRIPPDERMVYVDWNVADMVGFITGATSVQVPRFMNFDPSLSTSSRRVKPFFTELSHYQSNSNAFDLTEDNVDVSPFSEICCSKISRVYNFEGQLKQGCTSFSTLRRFGEDDDQTE